MIRELFKLLLTLGTINITIWAKEIAYHLLPLQLIFCFPFQMVPSAVLDRLQIVNTSLITDEPKTSSHDFQQKKTVAFMKKAQRPHYPLSALISVLDY